MISSQAHAFGIEATFPDHWSTDAVLVDGGTIHLRPIGPADGEALVEFHNGLSHETTYLRFFSPHPRLSDDEVRWFTNVDHHNRVAFVAELGGRIVGVGRYDRIEATTSAEVAFVVADGQQGRGIGTVLLEQLAAAARERGINRFVAETLYHNARMLSVFRDAGFAEVERADDGSLHVEMGIEPTERSRAASESREHRAESRSIARMLGARSVAVIGASRKPGNLGHQVLRNLVGQYDGVVFPVEGRGSEVSGDTGDQPARSPLSITGMRAYPSLAEVPDAVELAVIAEPAEHVLDAVRDCADAGVSDVVVLSAGFSETGPEGAALERELRDLARGNGMRLVGPNCLGIANPAIGLNATISPWAPSKGSVGIMTQSGALGIALLDRLRRTGLGVSSFVSVGNRADVSGNDLLHYWEDDAATKVVGAYLESFGNPRRFARIARRVSRRKPIVAVKAGRTQAGARAALSHTAADASLDIAVDALFRQTGVIRVDDIDDLIDTIQVLDRQPLPSGRRLAIVGNSGGAAVMAADACAASGLELATFDPFTRRTLADIAGSDAAVANPVNLAASTTPDTFEAAVSAVLADAGVDAVVAICTPLVSARPEELAAAVGRAALDADKPVAACFVAWPEMPPTVSAELPRFTTPEPAVRAIGRAAAYAAWHRRNPGTVPELDGIVPLDAKDVVAAALDDEPGGRWLSPVETERVLAAYGARPAPAQTPTTEAVRVVVGVTHDPVFGPLVMVRPTGPAAALRDRALRILPVTDVDAAELVRSVRVHPLILGERHEPLLAFDALEEVVLRVARLAGDLPEIAEIDVDPVIVSRSAATVLKARIRVAPSAEPPTLDFPGMTSG